MTIDLSNNNPRVEYSVAQGVTQTVFAVPFDFFEYSDVHIYVDGILKAEGTDYTLTGGDGSDGTLTFVTATPPEVQQVTGATGGSTVVIVRHVDLERASDFVSGQEINRAALNTQLDIITAQIADLDDRVDRTIHLSDSEIAPSMLLTDDRKGRVLAFNVSTGDVEAGPLSNDIAAIANNIAEILAVNDEAAAAAASANASAASAIASAASATTSAANKTAAQTAQTAAELAEANAETAASNAATSETNADAYATAAALSEAAADVSASAALASQVAASTSQSNALASQVATAISEANASSSEFNAAAYASNSAASAASSASSSASSSNFADASEYWADISAGYSEQIQSQAYNISTDSDFGDLTVVTGDFLNEINLDKLTMSRGSETYNYGVI